MEHTNKEIDLFVGGRLCLFGEHSDWAGHYRLFNSDIYPGNALVCGIEEGIYARISKCSQLEVATSLPDGSILRFSCPMKLDELREVARKGGFFSYIAGVTAHLLTFYEIGGLKLNCYKTTLPLKKGLSSSAAICVLTARAFNQLYALNMTTRGEMEAAYYGEQMTPSRCGRLDQACAYGRIPTHLRFNGDMVDVSPVHVGNPLYWVFADLQGEKDTISILRDLNRAYPYPNTDQDRMLHDLFGRVNAQIVDEALEAIAKGDAQSVGELMTKAQELFDKVAISFSKELEATRLHAILKDSTVRALSYGGKGVGSQGDGCVQFIARDENCQKRLKEHLMSLGMDTYTFTLPKTRLVRRAIIPVAGLGTRMYPATKVLFKELLPIVDADGMAKPALLVLLEELDDAGIEKIALIVRPGAKAIYEKLFEPTGEIHSLKLSQAHMDYEKRLRVLSDKIEYIEQTEPMGFGHAVYQSRIFASGEPVLLCLGDHVYASKCDKSCTKQLLECFEGHQRLTVSITETPLDKVGLYGIVHGAWEDIEKQTIMNISRFVEKPTRQFAKEELGVLCRTKKKYFSVFGQYIFTDEVYEQLDVNISHGKKDGGEFQLTSALEDVCKRYGAIGFRVEGMRYDIGIPEEYRNTINHFSRDS